MCRVVAFKVFGAGEWKRIVGGKKIVIWVRLNDNSNYKWYKHDWRDNKGQECLGFL
jgi:hypothetical protein